MKSKRKIFHRFLPVGCGALAWICANLLLGPWISLGWRRPIQDWMTAHGAGSLTGYFGILYIQLPAFALAILGGVTIGVVAWRRWRDASMLFSGTMFGIPYIMMASSSFTRTMFIRSGVGWILILVLLDSLVVPLALGGAWVASRGRRRRAARMAAGHCIKCGYDLRGDVSGRCPECATPVAYPPVGPAHEEGAPDRMIGAP